MHDMQLYLAGQLNWTTEKIDPSSGRFGDRALCGNLIVMNIYQLMTCFMKDLALMRLWLIFSTMVL